MFRGDIMSTKMKIIKTFYADIKSCKDYTLLTKELCIVSRDGKFGLAERHINGKLSLLIDCEYDYIDSFCPEGYYSNIVGVLKNGKWGLYAFKYTVSTKSNKIDCKQVAECDYDFVSVNISPDIAVLHKRNETGYRYYNLNSDRISPVYVTIIPVDE